VCVCVLFFDFFVGGLLIVRDKRLGVKVGFLSHTGSPILEPAVVTQACCVHSVFLFLFCLELQSDFLSLIEYCSHGQVIVGLAQQPSRPVQAGCEH
jgi:hypothetical protein